LGRGGLGGGNLLYLVGLVGLWVNGSTMSRHYEESDV
jgi:hypothetical protein